VLTLTKKVDYGIIALSYLAGRPGRTASASEMARRFGLPQFLLANIMKELTSRGLVVSVRGVHGGYRLARGPESITLADMIRALEDEDKIALADCVSVDGNPRDDNCRISETCPVKSPLRKVHNRLQALFRDVTLAELAEPGEPPETAPLDADGQGNEHENGRAGHECRAACEPTILLSLAAAAAPVADDITSAGVPSAPEDTETPRS
jgi:Rrf2 family protein